MKKIFTTAFVVMLPLLILAQGWPARYDGVMLQGFYWDSHNDSKWTKLESQADELAEFFKLVWIPQSGNCDNPYSMGYDDMYWFTDYNSGFGNEPQLRSMINTFKSKGIGTIADVVINHRKSKNGWFGFPIEVYKGTTYSMSSTDVCSTDDGGKALAEANRLGVQLGNPDTGEDWDGMRDLDHKSANVQRCVKAYLKFLLNDLGYAGFRYDMTKGYAASYTGMYNKDAAPEFSVGEYWDGNPSALKNWIEGTKVDGAIQSAAFDFTFRYTIRDAVNNNNWANLGGNNKGLCMEDNYKRYVVTFIENHDTEYRSASAPQDPISKNIEAANAYLLAMPGTPCIFLKHWKDYKESIKQMIYVRQLAGINNMSATQKISSNSANHVQRTTGTRGGVMVLMGGSTFAIPATYVLVASGTNYRLALSKTTETAWVSKPSGEYHGAIDVTFTAVSQTDAARLVYTLDGSEPTASNGTVVNDGSTITISKIGKNTLKVGLLINGAVSGVITRNYELDSFEPYEITVFLKDPTVAPNNWTQVNYFSWDDTSSPNGGWPGETITQTKEVNGVKFYYDTYTIKSKDYYVNFVFNQGSSSGQTEDVTHVNKTSFFEIATQTNKYKVNDVTNQYLPYIDGFAKGDVNGDGEVNIADVNCLVGVILGTRDADEFGGRAFVNDDDEVNIADVNAVIAIILGN